MAYINGPKIVTDGLVLVLDAGNTKSYPGSGTTWTDLSGNGRNGTLVNGPTFDSANGGSIVFDGVNDACNFAANIFNTGTPQDGTFYLRFKAPILSTVDQTILFNDGGSSNNLVYFYRNSNFATNRYSWLIYYTNTSAGVSNYLQGSTFLPSVWYDTALTYNSSGTAAIYVNGNLINRQTVANFQSWNRTGNNIPYIAIASSQGTGAAQVFMWYNRALTPQEIQQNLNATRQRIGV